MDQCLEDMYHMFHIVRIGTLKIKEELVPISFQLINLEAFERGEDPRGVQTEPLRVEPI